MAHRNSWFTYSKWWLSKCFVCLPEGVEFTIAGKRPWSIVYPISSGKSHYYYLLVVIMYYLLFLYPSIIQCPIWVNYNNSLTWIKAIWGWFPLFTMIPVRENSEVVIIYPDPIAYPIINPHGWDTDPISPGCRPFTCRQAERMMTPEMEKAMVITEHFFKKCGKYEVVMLWSGLLYYTYDNIYTHMYIYIYLRIHK